MPSGTEVASQSQELANLDPAMVYSVAELSQDIKKALSLDPHFNNILLKGEISNFTKAASGHIYFNLIDENYANCAIACTLFRNSQESWSSDLRNGIQIAAVGSVIIYEPRSQYQLKISKIEPLGDGVLSLKLKRIKAQLEEEGLFSQDRKRYIPRLPRKVGILTSRDSTAIKDILTVVNSQCAKTNLVFAYVSILGNGAPSSIIQGLNSLENANGVDTIILARGGGPSEDFLVFNDEMLVRAIASSSKPIITGIGHERDICLADLAADLRASTPSTAAKEAIPDIRKLKGELQDLNQRLERSYDSCLKSFEIQKKEVEIGKKEEEVKQAIEVSRSDVSKYKLVIIALIALLAVIVLILLLRG